jgi:hypothetical protein
MKNLTLSAALIAASVFVSLNKVAAQKGLQLGFELNPQLSYLYNQDDVDSDLWDRKSAFNGHFGFSGQYGITENIGVGLNILYSIQGDKYDWKGTERLKSLQYFKIPVLFTLNLPFGDNMSFIGKVGPQVSILTDARLYDADKKILKTNYTAAFASYDFGGMISAGIGAKLTDQVTLDGSIRFDTGFTNAESEDFKQNIHNPYDFVTPSPASSPRGNAYNMTIGLNVGLRYTFL